MNFSKIFEETQRKVDLKFQIETFVLSCLLGENHYKNTGTEKMK